MTSPAAVAGNVMEKKKKGKVAASTTKSKAASGSGRKGGKQDVLRGTKKGKVEKVEKVAPPKLIMENGTIRDMSGPAMALCKDKFLLGSNHTVQVGSVNFSGTRAYSYEALIFSREPRPLKDGEEEKDGEVRKPFRYNMPTPCIAPLRNALTAILQRSGREPLTNRVQAAASMEMEG